MNECEYFSIAICIILVYILITLIIEYYFLREENRYWEGFWEEYKKYMEEGYEDE